MYKKLDFNEVWDLAITYARGQAWRNISGQNMDQRKNQVWNQISSQIHDQVRSQLEPRN